MSDLDTDNPSATVELVERDGETNFAISALTTAGFSIQGEITRETAENLVQRFRLQFMKVDDKQRQAGLEAWNASITRARRVAMLRNDAFVNPRFVLCAHDHCCMNLRSEGGRHPWELAIENGWKLHMTSDLLCPDCGKPKGDPTKEDCPY